MRHREKLRQDMREKERERDRKLKKLGREENEEKDKETTEVSVLYLNVHFECYFSYPLPLVTLFFPVRSLADKIFFLV